ncbi:DUF6883 domain-containing protein [Gemmatimonas sp.]|uniref:DUF6883 domain-containing protein n=1 Tax=Gemmatimonas sp. TaxID=1962908 RepID=UPI0039839C28
MVALRAFARAGRAVVFTGHELPLLLLVVDRVTWCTAGTTREFASVPRAMEDFGCRSAGRLLRMVAGGSSGGCGGVPHVRGLPHSRSGSLAGSEGVGRLAIARASRGALEGARFRILRIHARAAAASVFGQKNAVCGTVHGPSGETALVVTVWIFLTGETRPRFVTAHAGNLR